MNFQKTIEEIELIRESALLVSKTLGILAKEIKEGVTTKNQIQAMFGSPFKTSYTDNGSLIWTYQ